MSEQRKLTDEKVTSSFSDFFSKKYFRTFYVLITILVIICLVSFVYVTIDVNFALGVALLLLFLVVIALLIKSTTSVFKRFRKSFGDIIAMNKEKEDVIVAFSHSIREPLNNQMISLDILRAQETYVSNDIFDSFESSIKDMVTSVNDLTFKFAGIISVSLRKKIVFNLSQTTNNSILFFKGRGNGNFNITVNEKGESNVSFFGDPITIKQLILYVLQHIEKQTMGIAQVDLGLLVEKINEQSYKATYSIKTGENIFSIDEPDNSRSLFVQLLSILDGNYSLTSDGSSSILSFSFPLVAVADVERKQIASSKIKEFLPQRGISTELSEARVLLVEDNLINQKVTSYSIRGKVKAIDTAVNGKVALEMFGNSRYDIILMDIQMPVMDGLTATQKIRSLEESTNFHTPIIAITANALIGDMEKCLASGFDRYLSKPIQADILLEAMKELLQQFGR